MNIIAPNRNIPYVDEAGRPTLRVADVMEALAREVSQLTSNDDAYTVDNVAIDRDLDAGAANIPISAVPTQAEVETIRDAVLEIADVLGTLIEDLKAAGVIP